MRFLAYVVCVVLQNRSCKYGWHSLQNRSCQCGRHSLQNRSCQYGRHSVQNRSCHYGLHLSRSMTHPCVCFAQDVGQLQVTVKPSHNTMGQFQHLFEFLRAVCCTTRMPSSTVQHRQQLPDMAAILGVAQMLPYQKPQQHHHKRVLATRPPVECIYLPTNSSLLSSLLWNVSCRVFLHLPNHGSLGLFSGPVTTPLLVSLWDFGMQISCCVFGFGID